MLTHPHPARLLHVAFLQLGLCLCLLGTGGAAFASDDDHEQARQALLRGDVLPLVQLLQHLDKQRPGGHILEVELEQKNGQWVYEIKQLEAGGQLVKIKLDAKTGELLQTKPRRSSSDSKKP
ncbi:MAG: PepSY domain-containing protein [Burkholderiales bacterium]|nr:PepSY domain-containing protein [Burkholderiales bacterium]